MARFRDILRGWGPADPRNILKWGSFHKKIQIRSKIRMYGSFAYIVLCLPEHSSLFFQMDANKCYGALPHGQWKGKWLRYRWRWKFVCAKSGTRSPPSELSILCHRVHNSGQFEINHRIFMLLGCSSSVYNSEGCLAWQNVLQRCSGCVANKHVYCVSFLSVNRRRLWW